LTGNCNSVSRRASSRDFSVSPMSAYGVMPLDFERLL